jgi:assimilatory nitrate reductase catalytic subunit
MADGSGPLSLGQAVKTTCPYCGVGCGVSATAGADRALAVSGDSAHPANLGRLCSKGTALGSTVGLGGRLLHPTVFGREVGWQAAIRTTADAFSRAIAEYGPDSVAFYVSGQLLTEDYYVANKLMKGFIGSSNIDTNSRLCMASAVGAHKLAFGADLVPGCYEDLDLADLVVFSGHNAAWTHPVLFRRMEAQRARGQRQVVIDPRRTDTAEGADLHLPLAPQSDVRLWNGLLADLLRRGAVDRGYVAAHVSGFAEVEAALRASDQSVHAVAADCGVAAADLETFFGWFAETPRTVSLFSMGANQSAQGVSKGLAIVNAHLATGRIGKPGAAPFSITGQPNAMGGREVGGMANMLAAHMDFDEPSCARVQRFWGSPTIARGPGLKAVDMFEAVHDGGIKAIWIMATNPVVSLPNATRVREALANCPFVAVSDCMADTDTMAYAHVALPALGWGEKDGTVTNSERRISRQRPTMATPGEAQADWRIISRVAAAMGHKEAFGWRNPCQVFREWARLTAYENQGRRMLDLGPLAAITPAAYEALEPVQWPVTAQGGTGRLFTDGRFQTPDGRAMMHPLEAQGPARTTDSAYPLSLNTGRVRDHWHTLTRTGLAPELCRHAPEPYVEMHPADAAPLGLGEGRLTRVRTAQGEAVAVAKLSDRQRPGSIFMPMHWSAAYAPSGQANPLVSDARDPCSGQPEFKHTPARMSAYRETWRGFFLARDAWPMPKGLDLVWRRIPEIGCQLHEFAGRGDEAEREALRAALTKGATGDLLRYEDARGGTLREAHVEGGRLNRILFTTTGDALPPRDWLAGLFAAAALDATQRAALLVGREPGVPADTGPVVCSCRNVRATRIDAAIAAGACTLDSLCEASGAGVTCGSCRPELARMLSRRLEVRDAA